MRWLRSLVLVLAIAAPAAAVTLADLPLAAAQAKPARSGPAGKASGGKRAKVLEKIRTMRAARLAQVLALDDATSARLFAVLDRYDALILPLKAEMGLARRELKQMLRSGTFDDARGNALIDRILAARAQVAKLEDQRNLELRKVLTPRQVAVLIVALPEIDRFIEKQIRKAAGAKAGAQGDDPAGDPADD